MKHISFTDDGEIAKDSMQPALDLRQLAYFARVAECGSFTRAAQILHVAQPGISMAVRKLEEFVGMTLLLRAKGGVVLTSEGEVLLSHAKRILASVDNACTDIDSLRGLKTGSTKIGIPPQFFSETVIMRVIDFMQRHPGLGMKLVDAGAIKLKKMLLDGLVDIAFLSGDELDPEFDAHLMRTDELVVVAAPGHEIFSHEVLELPLLARYPLAVVSESYWHRRVVDRVASFQGFEPEIRFECSRMDVLKVALRHSAMVAPLVRECVEDDPSLACRGFSPSVPIAIYLCRKPTAPLSLANEALLAYLLAARGIDVAT